MKKITFLAFMLVGVFAYSQEYFPLVEENNEWNVLQVIYDGISLPWDTIYWSMSYKISGDTVIDNKAYKKVFKSEEEFPVSWQYWGGMREENQEAWYIGINNYPESKIYDFDLSVGDTINFIFDFQPMAVDSIVFKEINGEDRKHIYFSYPNMGYTKECWIEGIGSNRGILQSGTAGFVGGWTWMMCKSENQQLIYMNPDYETCYMISTGIEDNRSGSKLRVYPNPAKGNFFVRLPDNISGNECILKMYNAQGELFEQINATTGDDRFILDSQKFPKGMYLIKVETESRVFTSKVVIR
ncbi:MAG: T9SS type A sorting domain-containing protein [Bacteroidales bacterium]|nr:T9SS type A sorting domain-containing protein [Bacteroidales bacterium]